MAVMNKEEYLRIHCLDSVKRQYGYGYFEQIIDTLGIDLFNQYTESQAKTEYYKLKLINQHAFQAGFTRDCILKLKAEGKLNTDDPLVLVDIGDSAGTHLKYQKYMLKEDFTDIRCVSVNLDPEAVDKIRMDGGDAVLCRAEDYQPGDEVSISCYLSYQMVEHLHNPALFFHRMAKSNNGQYMVVTVPYQRTSRVGLRYSEWHESFEFITAEQEHIFELSPKDWQKLIRHSGWKVIDDRTYFQYPVDSIFASYYRKFWNASDFEGFYAMFLERDMTVADKYTAWED